MSTLWKVAKEKEECFPSRSPSNSALKNQATRSSYDWLSPGARIYWADPDCLRVVDPEGCMWESSQLKSVQAAWASTPLNTAALRCPWKCSVCQGSSTELLRQLPFVSYQLPGSSHRLACQEWGHLQLEHRIKNILPVLWPECGVRTPGPLDDTSETGSIF